MMRFETLLKMPTSCAVKAQNAGLFISRGQGTHPTRVIDSHELIFVKEGRMEMWGEAGTFCVAVVQSLHVWPTRRHGGIGTLAAGLECYWMQFELNGSSGAADEKEAVIEAPQLSRVSRPQKRER